MASAAQRDAQPSSSRIARSRLDRPCDTCRRHKHLCIIPVRDEPCMGCKTRNRSCTFDMPPLVRKRKRASSSEARSAITTKKSPSMAENMGSSSAVTLPILQQPMSSDRTVLQDSNTWPEIVGDEGTKLGQANLLQNLAEQASQIRADTSSWYQPDHMTHTAPAQTSNPTLNTNTDLSFSPLPQSPKLPPLDTDNDETQESHFLGAVAYSGFTAREISPTDLSANSEVPFRQVSSDPRTPVFFVKNPSLLYGRTQISGKAAYHAVLRVCAPNDKDMLSKALSKLQQVTLPAMPFINFQRLETSVMGLPGSGPVPYAILAGAIAHCNPYIPEIRPLNTELWSQALLALDDEYRLPRLATLQVALLQLCSRPQERGENTGQAEIATARAIGTAHLLGLHMDPSNWSLPLWERRLRKRIWWILFIFDKWRALIFGRPRTIHAGDHTVSLPTIEDSDYGSNISPSDRISMESFIAHCRLTNLIDKILENFCRVQSIFEPTSHIARIALLESYLMELGEYETSLPLTLQFHSEPERVLANLPTGVRSFQLSYLGLRVIIHRLLLDVISNTSVLQNIPVLQGAFDACQFVVTFAQHLRASERNGYWGPLSSHHFFNTISLLLRVISRAQSSNVNLPFDPADSLRTFLVSLGTTYGTDRWEIAGVTLRRAVGLFTMIEKDFPVARDMYNIVADILGLPPRPADDVSTDFYTSFGLEELNPSVWPGNDLFWLSDFNPLLGGTEE